MDAICAAKIFQYILRFDNVIYVLVPVKTTTELKKVFKEQKADVNDSIWLYFISLLYFQSRNKIYLITVYFFFPICR